MIKDDDDDDDKLIVESTVQIHGKSTEINSY